MNSEFLRMASDFNDTTDALLNNLS